MTLSFKKLRDAILVNLTVDRPTGDLRFKFDVSTGDITSVCLLAHGLRSLKCAKEHPWGRPFR